MLEMKNVIIKFLIVIFNKSLFLKNNGLNKLYSILSYDALINKNVLTPKRQPIIHYAYE